MLNAIKQLKQQNEVAFNFALAGLIAFLLAVSGLVLLWHGLIEQKQIAKQVGDLQMIESRIETIVMSKKLDFGEEKAFLEFDGHIKNFNQQWTEFKQQHDYSDKTIKEVDVVWQRVNGNAQKILANKTDIIRLNTVRIGFLSNIKSMQKFNEKLINMLSKINNYSNQSLVAKNLTIYLPKEEASLKILFEMPEYFIGYEDDEMGRIFGEVSSVLSLFLSEGHNIKKIEDEKVKEIIKQEKIIFEKTSILHKQLYFEGRYKLNQVKELQSAIYRDSPELKSTLVKLNNHQLNKGLIVFVVCFWLAFFACVVGFLRALNTKHID